MHRAVDSDEASTSNLAGQIRGQIPGRDGLVKTIRGWSGRWKIVYMYTRSEVGAGEWKKELSAGGIIDLLLTVLGALIDFFWIVDHQTTQP